ncbi:hypothetical protein GJ496_003092 [Pomphorhynchus laevis]|nr:hypothetical protein GJ496_003092 [Pomphorhynchus laevis]
MIRNYINEISTFIRINYIKQNIEKHGVETKLFLVTINEWFPKIKVRKLKYGIFGFADKLLVCYAVLRKVCTLNFRLDIGLDVHDKCANTLDILTFNPFKAVTVAFKLASFSFKTVTVAFKLSVLRLRQSALYSSKITTVTVISYRNKSIFLIRQTDKMSIRLIVRRIKPPMADYVFESEEQPQKWSIGLVKAKLISKYIDAGFNRLRIIYQGRILQNPHLISDIIQSSECRQTLVLYMVNLDEVSTTNNESSMDDVQSLFSSTDTIEHSESEDNAENCNVNQCTVQVENCVDQSGCVNQLIQTDDKLQPKADDSNTVLHNTEINIDEFYSNYVNLISRAGTDVNACTDLHAEHHKLFAFQSSFANSYIQTSLSRCTDYLNAHNVYPSSLQHRYVISSGIESHQVNIPRQDEADAGPALAGGNLAGNQNNHQEPPIDAVNPIWEVLMRQVRQHDPFSRFIFLLKLIILISLLYMYEGLSRLLTLTFLVILVYIAQHTGLVRRWLGVQRRMRDVVPEQRNFNDNTANNGAANAGDHVNEENQNNDQSRWLSTLRSLVNVVFSLFFSIVPIEDNFVLDAA